MRSLVETIQRTQKDQRWRLVRRELDKCVTSGDSARISAILDSLARIGRQWEKWLIEHLSELVAQTPQDPLAPLLLPFLETATTVTLVLRDRETGASLSELESLLGRLESIRRNPRPRLRVDFQTPHAYVYGLCAISAWAAAHAADIRFESQFPRVLHFLERAGVVEGFRDPASEPVRFDTETIFGFTRVDPNKQFQTDAHAGRLVELFRKHMVLSEKTAVALSISFAELIENAIKHGEITSPAWLFANFHPQPKILHVCICDRGLGVQRTFEQSSSQRLRSLATDPTAWIREATKPLVTSKSEGHAG